MDKREAHTYEAVFRPSLLESKGFEWKTLQRKGRHLEYCSLSIFKMTTEKPADVEMKEEENKENAPVEKTQEEKDALSFEGS